MAWHSRTLALLTSVNRSVLKALISRNPSNVELREDERHHGDAAWLERKDQRDCPVVYVRNFVNRRTKVLPTPRQQQKALERVRKYCEPEQRYIAVAHAIDNSRRERTQQHHLQRGRRYYLADRGMPLPNRVAIAQRFCDRLEAKLAELPMEAQDQPAEKSLLYVGVAANFAARARQHENHNRKSCWVMRLFCDALAIGDGGTDFVFDDIPVAWVAHQDEYCAGELLTTLITDAYSGGGGGFCVSTAGLNPIQTEGMDVPWWIDMRADAAQFIIDHTDYLENVDYYLALGKHARETGPALHALALEKQRVQLGEIEEMKRQLASNKADYLREAEADINHQRAILARLEPDLDEDELRDF
ncbi:hypothetical protein PTMSG1_05577 [Pyrenophora teres f. maculata]|nr:hypothetical protein PTMSG1_05577 [Pyrenophora teres f. maculata]